MIYMAFETVVYYIGFIIADNLIPTKWFRAPIKWNNDKRNQMAEGDESERIVVEELVKNYGEVRALNKIGFKIEAGETLAIIGLNGAGKSSLLGILAGCCPSSSGRIQFCGQDLTINISTIHQFVGYCPQDNLFMNELHASEWIEALCVSRGVPDDNYSAVFSALGLDAQLTGRIGSMSGGNKSQVCLAASLIGNLSIVVLDKATSGVDFTGRT
jgi:ABC-type multidrug transport system ATPase subunit